MKPDEPLPTPGTAIDGSRVPELSEAELDALVEAQVRVSEEWLASGGVVSERMQRHIERTTAELMAGSPGHEPKPWDPK